MQLSEFDYDLPPERIAQTPIEPRHAARLMIIDRASGEIEHRRFLDLPTFLRRGDVLVANDTRVLPARLYGRKETGGKVEILLLRELSPQQWEVLVGGKGLRAGVQVQIEPGDLRGTISEVLSEARRIITFEAPLTDQLPGIGHTPLPPYIHQPLEDSERYQTVYSREEGSAAAPTAGLHFSPEVLLQLRDQGVLLEYLTLHIGLDTFKPVNVDNIAEHTIHTEWTRLSARAAQNINQAKLAGKRVVAVGTTSMRVLETAALRSAGVDGSLQQASDPDQQLDICPWRPVTAIEEATDLFIRPGFRFRAVDSLITNFHLPRSSLLMLVGAFMGMDLMRRAYEMAIAEQYRFYSFGDAMLIL